MSYVGKASLGCFGKFATIPSQACLQRCHLLQCSIVRAAAYPWLCNLSCMPCPPVLYRRQTNHKSGTRRMAGNSSNKQTTPRSTGADPTACTTCAPNNTLTLHNLAQPPEATTARKGRVSGSKLLKCNKETLCVASTAARTMQCSVPGALLCSTLPHGLPDACCAGPVAAGWRTSWARLTVVNQGAPLPSTVVSCLYAVCVSIYYRVANSTNTMHCQR